MIALPIVQLTLEVMNLAFEVQDMTNPSEGQSLVGQAGHLLNQVDFDAGVPTLAAIGPRRPDDRFGVQPAKKRGLDTEHLRDLSDRIERGMLIVERSRIVLNSSVGSGAPCLG